MRVSLPFFHGLAAATILRCIQGKSLFYKGHLGTVEATTNNDTFSAQGGFYASALDTLKVFLVQSLGASGDEDLQLDEASAEDIIDENGDMHLRYLHYIDGLRVEGAAMMMHIRANGSVYAVNGEYSPTSDYAAQTTLDCVDAIGIALVELDIEKGDFLSSCDVAAVNGRDGLFHKAYKALIGHSQDGGRQKSLVYASMTTGEPLALHPQVFGAHSLIMRDCQNTLYYCEIVTYRSRNQAARDAVLHATTTLDFFLETFGRNSVDGKGATITLNVNYDNRANNAYYADLGVWYGSGDGSKFTYFSKGLDVTAHEITHGVTYYTSSLIYENDSGAINEAMSDIIGATVERIMGNKSIRNVWIMGEDITLSGTGVRNMANPAEFEDADWYPDRYQGTADRGGVHINSGIMNLAFQLMVEGGTHPRGKSSTVVTPLSTDFGMSILTAARIFYKANTSCLTPRSTFLSARECTLTFAGGYAATVAAAWDAVGVFGTTVGRSSSKPARKVVARCLTAQVQKRCKCNTVKASTCWRTVALKWCLRGNSGRKRFLLAVQKGWSTYCSNQRRRHRR